MKKGFGGDSFRFFFFIRSMAAGVKRPEPEVVDPDPDVIDQTPELPLLRLPLSFPAVTTAGFSESSNPKWVGIFNFGEGDGDRLLTLLSDVTFGEDAGTGLVLAGEFCESETAGGPEQSITRGFFREDEITS